MRSWNEEIAKEFAKQNNIPYKIELKTRRGLVETTLVLVGYCMDEVNYKINAEYPFSLHGESGSYVAIDFSEGPLLSPGYVIDNVVFHDIVLHSIEEGWDDSIMLVFKRSDGAMFTYPEGL